MKISIRYNAIILFAVLCLTGCENVTHPLNEGVKTTPNLVEPSDILESTPAANNGGMDPFIEKDPLVEWRNNSAFKNTIFVEPQADIFPTLTLTFEDYDSEKLKEQWFADVPEGVGINEAHDERYKIHLQERINITSDPYETLYGYEEALLDSYTNHLSGTKIFFLGKQFVLKPSDDNPDIKRTKDVDNPFQTDCVFVLSSQYSDLQGFTAIENSVYLEKSNSSFEGMKNTPDEAVSMAQDALVDMGIPMWDYELSYILATNERVTAQGKERHPQYQIGFRPLLFGIPVYDKEFSFVAGNGESLDITHSLENSWYPGIETTVIVNDLGIRQVNAFMKINASIEKESEHLLPLYLIIENYMKYIDNNPKVQKIELVYVPVKNTENPAAGEYHLLPAWVFQREKWVFDILIDAATGRPIGATHDYIIHNLR